jgi:hypothetical protein
MGGMKDLFGDEPYTPRTKPRSNCNGETGDQAKKRGLDQIRQRTDPIWRSNAFHIIASLPIGWRGTAEDWKHIIIDKIGHPHHPNVWGEIARETRIMRLVKATGAMIKPRDSKSHSRPISEYVRV